VSGPCWNEAPQLAARVGRYKLYLNPPVVEGAAPSRVELYDVREALVSPIDRIALPINLISLPIDFVFPPNLSLLPS
jgi:hypothetical protein